MPTEQTTTAPVASEAPAPSGAPTESVESLKTALAEREKRLEQLARENADRRTRAKEAQTAAEKALEEQGQYKALAEERAKRVAELEQYEADAKAFRAYQAQKAEALKAKRETLPPAVAAAFDAAEGNVAAQEAIVAAFAGVPEAPPKAKNGPTLTSGAGPTDWRAALADPVLWAAAKQADPQGAAAYMKSIAGGAAGASPDSIVSLTAHRPVVRR